MRIIENPSECLWIWNSHAEIILMDVNWGYSKIKLSKFRFKPLFF